MERDWSTAVPDWEERILKGEPPLPRLPLCDAYADRALAIFRKLRIPDLPGKPTFGEVCEPWVLEFVRVVFGTYDPEVGARIVREFFLLIPKKNSKTTISAGIIVTAAILNARPFAEMILISSSHQVAGIAFATARGIIQADRDLEALFKVQSHLKTITHRLTEATIRILSADGDVVTGSKASVILVDELHVLGAKPRADEIMTELRGGLASRSEGFLLIITTQSKKEPSGQYKRELAHARAVRDGSIVFPMVAVLYELPRKMQKSEAWRDQDTWRLVNPNLGVSVDEQYLRDEFAKALEAGPDALALFASQHLNIEIGLGLHSDRWVGADYWPRCADEALTGLEALIARVDVAVVGGDIGGADDLMGLTVLGRERDTRRWLTWSHGWCVPDALKNRKEIAPRLQDFADAGELTIHEDVDLHIAEAVDICTRLRDAQILPDERAIGLDPWGVAALVDALFEAEFTEDQVFGVQQGFRLNGAIKGLERRLLQGRILHGDQAIMRWNLGNAKAEARGNNIMITKAQAGVAKIDLLMSLFNAVVLMDMNPEAGGAVSYLDETQLVVF